MNDRLKRWLTILINTGEIPLEDRPLLKEHLADAKGKKGEDLFARVAHRSSAGLVTLSAMDETVAAFRMNEPPMA